MADNQDNPGIRVPPPLIYLLPLAAGLILDRRWHVPFLPRGVARPLGWALFVSSWLVGGWFMRTIERAGTPIRTDRPVPRLVTPTVAVGGVRDPAPGDRARRTLPGAHLRGGVSGLQDAGAALGVAGAISENSVKRKSNFGELFLSNKRSVSMFAATSGKGNHVLPTSRRPSVVLISFGREESRPSGLPHLQPNQHDLAQRCPNRRALRRARN